MNKILTILLLLIIGCTTAGNTDKVDSYEKKILPNEKIKFKFDNFNIDTTLTQSLKELSLTVAEKESLIKKVKGQYDYYLQSEWAIKRKPFLDNFTFLELNDDGKPDLLFQGWQGGEPECVRIHFSNSTGFDSPVSFYQYLKDIKIENRKIITLTTVDPGCCAEYVEQELTYEFDQEFKYKLIFHRARIRTLPGKYDIFDSPISFTVENEVYKLRGEPMIDDTGTFVYDYYNEGNTMAIFEKGSQGRAWARDNSDPKREWWYVEMEPIQDSLDFDMFRYYDEQGQLRRMGWMSSRFLKK